MGRFKINIVFTYFDVIHFDFATEGERDNIFKQMMKAHKQHQHYFWKGLHVDLGRANYIRTYDD